MGRNSRPSKKDNVVDGHPEEEWDSEDSSDDEEDESLVEDEWSSSSEDSVERQQAQQDGIRAATRREQKRRQCVLIGKACLICMIVTIFLGLAGGLGYTLFELRPFGLLPTDDTPMPTAAPTTPPTKIPTASPTFTTLSLTRLIADSSFDGGQSLLVNDSPQQKAFNWIQQNQNLNTYADDKILQRFALATLYFATNGDTWIKSDNWLSDEDECEWFPNGTFCGPLGGGMVTDLKIQSNNLLGKLPPELALLSNHLTSLDLSGNSLTGNIPTMIGSLTNLLALSLEENGLTGIIPTEVGNITKLELLDLHVNKFDGGIPTEIGKLIKSRYLNLQNSAISGTIPTELGLLTDLQVLELGHNPKLAGSLISEIGRLTNLQIVMIEDVGRDLNGNLPSEIGLLTNLRVLILSHNGFRGTIPTELASLKSLKELDLSWNNLGGKLFDGFFTGLRQSIEYIQLEENYISGTMSTRIGLLQNLRTLSLGSNTLSGGPFFTGHIPNEIGGLKSLESLELSGCSFSGHIPSEVGLMDDLIIVDFHNNELNGTIPTEFGLLNKLENLDLYSNHLEGPVPSELGNVNTLVEIDLTMNQLVGGIPSELGLLNSLDILNLQFNEIQGTVPSEICALDGIGIAVDCGKVVCSCCISCPLAPSPTAPTLAPTVSRPTLSPGPTAAELPITIVLQLDKFPGETGWTLICNGNTIASVPFGTYSVEDQLVTEIFPVDLGASCEFTINDQTGDGLCCMNNGNKGYYQILINNKLVDADFDTQNVVTFTIPDKFPPLSAVAAPTVSPYPTGSWEPTPTFVFVTVIIQFHNAPQETGWNLECDTVLVTSVPVGTYSSGSADISVTLPISYGDVCTFTIVDTSETSDYQILIGDTPSGTGVLVGEGTAQDEFLFIASLVGVSDLVNIFGAQ